LASDLRSVVYSQPTDWTKELTDLISEANQQTGTRELADLRSEEANQQTGTRELTADLSSEEANQQTGTRELTDLSSEPNQQTGTRELTELASDIRSVGNSLEPVCRLSSELRSVG
jgi:hypothetical protein